ncbi:MAG: heterodisulfide reductase-related iron-sulfur binding cluster, partial [Bacteroidota bacterium]|nr:heterodisulfide reductase-related iron-sulfur binding cluster [Bacteroidota bacterium]
MPLAVYPGCSLTGSSREYMESVEQILKTFEIPYTFVEDWNCCGATAAHNLNRKVAEALPARIIALAEKQGADEILVPCAACYNRLKSSQKKMDEDKVLKGQLSEMVGMPLDNGIKILNVLEVIEQSIVPKLNEKIQAPLNFKAACYYGCLLVRPG